MAQKSVSTEKGVKIYPENDTKNSDENTPEKVSENDVEILPAEGEKKAVKKASGSKKKRPKRDEHGRFIKGTSTPKSPGRPKKRKELEALVGTSCKEIKRILESTKTPDKLKFEVAKWVVEMSIGKPAQQVAIDGAALNVNTAMVVSFEGKLDEWSE